MSVLICFQEKCAGPAGNMAQIYAPIPLKQAHMVSNTVAVLKREGKRMESKGAIGYAWERSSASYWWFHWHEHVHSRDSLFRMQISLQSLTSSSCLMSPAHIVRWCVQSPCHQSCDIQKIRARQSPYKEAIILLDQLM